MVSQHRAAKGSAKESLCQANAVGTLDLSNGFVPVDGSREVMLELAYVNGSSLDEVCRPHHRCDYVVCFIEMGSTCMHAC